MTTLRKVLPLLLLCAALSGLPLAAQTQDCSFTYTFTGNSTQTAVSNLSGNTPCVNWRVTLSTTGTQSATVTFQTSPDNSSFTAVPNTICSSSVQPPCILQGTNPIVGTQGMMYTASYGSYVRVVVTLSSGTGTGTVRGYGVKGASASAGTGSGGGGGSGTVTSVGFTGGIVTVNTPTTTPALIIAGTSGGIPYFTSASTWATSAVLGLNRVVLGGGAGGAPTVTAADTTTTHALFATAGAPAFRAIAIGDLPTIPGAVACPENPISMTATNTYTCTDNLGVATGKFLWCQDPNSTPVNAAVQVSWAGATINTFTWVASTTETVNCYASLGGGSGGGGTGGLPWYPTIVSPQTLTNWTQINGGGNGTFFDATNAVGINTVSGQNNKALWQAAPGVPFTVTARILTFLPNSDYPGFGVWIGDSGTKMVNFTVGGQLASNDYEVGRYHWTNATTYFSTTGVDATIRSDGDLWYRMIYDGTNFHFQLSHAGTDNTFYEIGAEAANVFLVGAPAKIGFFAYSAPAGSINVKSVLVHWNVTTP